jgi:DNA-directed RNA polymerase subunit beta
MTPRGTFVINGVERVVVSQLVKSPGVFFTGEFARGRNWYGAKIIPNRGAWLEIDTDNNGVLSVKIDRKRRIPITALLRVFGYTSDEEILAAFADIDTNPDMRYMETLSRRILPKMPTKALKKFTKESALAIWPQSIMPDRLIEAMFFHADRYDLSEVGRYKLNQRLSVEDDREDKILTKQDLTDRLSAKLSGSTTPKKLGMTLTIFLTAA